MITEEARTRRGFGFLNGQDETGAGGLPLCPGGFGSAPIGPDLVETKYSRPSVV